ncbi:MAG: hypothetical protein JKY56_02375 [Kofleriaceae bacterium]|nr:hypothetical protein [Kofleriaceae bacterium]
MKAVGISFVCTLLLMSGCTSDSGNEQTVDSGSGSGCPDARAQDIVDAGIDAASLPSVDSGPSGCFGTTAASVMTTCEGFAVGMQCSPLQGCRESGTCRARQSELDCNLRGVSQCGFGVGLNNCHVEEGTNPPSTFRCVQTDRAGECENGQQIDRGSCINFDGSANTEGDVCVWDSGGTPTCIAMECEGFPVAQFCNPIDGCSWNN